MRAVSSDCAAGHPVAGLVVEGCQWQCFCVPGSTYPLEDQGTVVGLRRQKLQLIGREQGQPTAYIQTETNKQATLFFSSSAIEPH